MKTLLQCEPRSGGGCNDFMTSYKVKYLPRDILSEGRGEVSVKKKDQGKLKYSVNRARAATA
jgi:hypothetical protein